MIAAGDIELRDNAEEIIAKAIKDGYITEERIADMLPHYLKIEKSNREKSSRFDIAIKLIKEGVEKKGVVVVKDNNKINKIIKPLILDFPPFQWAKSEDKEIIKDLFGKPEAVKRNTTLFNEDEIIFVGHGTVSLEAIQDGDEFILYLFMSGMFFNIADGNTATVRSKWAYIWRLSEKKFTRLPREIKNFISIWNDWQDKFIGRLAVMANNNPTDRIIAFCEWLDTFPSHTHLTHNEIGLAINFTRETVTREKNEKKRRKKGIHR